MKPHAGDLARVAAIKSPHWCWCGRPADDDESGTCEDCRRDRHLGVLEDNREENRSERHG